MILDHWKNENIQLGPHRKYFSAYENKDRKAVESLLTKNFVFLPAHTTIALTARRISNGAGLYGESPHLWH
jgi:hypothetical protein